MSLRPLKTAFLACAWSLGSASIVCGQSFGGVGERAQGMGGAFVAVADDATATYWNPGGLAHVFKFDTQLATGRAGAFQDDEKTSQTVFFGAAMPALGLSYYRLRSAVLHDEDRQHDGSGEVRPPVFATNNVGVSLVQTVVSTVVVGTTLRVVGGSDSTAFDADVGMTASMGDVRLGIAARNLREALGLERQARMGLAYVPRFLPTGFHGPLSIAVDVDLTRSATSSADARYVAIGSEQWWRQGKLGTRAGIQWSAINEHAPRVSGGLTVKATQLVFVEGHVTKGAQRRATDWGAGLRVTF
jgi:hypothetical protein